MLFLVMLLIILGSLSVLYITIPILVIFYPSLVSSCVFLNGICPPNKVSKLDDPENAYQLEGVENVYIESPHFGQIGLWTMKPLNDSTTSTRIILYCHGNSFHRAFGHRLELYSILRHLGFWVITFDYRGYGDSTGELTETGAVEDILTVYSYIEEVFPTADNVIVWAHSLGTSFASKALQEINSRDFHHFPIGLILEAPFDSIEGIIENYPLSKVFIQIYPSEWMRRLILKALKFTNICLDTKEYLRGVSCNVMILHAEDDTKVHYKLGRALFDRMKEISLQGAHPPAIKFVTFREKHQLGHNGIYQHHDLPNLVEKFLKDANTGSIDKFVDVQL